MARGPKRAPIKQKLGLFPDFYFFGWMNHQHTWAVAYSGVERDTNDADVELLVRQSKAFEVL